MFDPEREAILLLGGDKQGNWDGWYDAAIREAEQLYSEHLALLETIAQTKPGNER